LKLSYFKRDSQSLETEFNKQLAIRRYPSHTLLTPNNLKYNQKKKKKVAPMLVEAHVQFFFLLSGFLDRIYNRYIAGNGQFVN
jgi:hypothetical protein